MNSEGVSGGSEVDAMVVLVVLWIGTKRKGVALYRLKKEGDSERLQRLPEDGFGFIYHVLRSIGR